MAQLYNRLLIQKATIRGAKALSYILPLTVPLFSWGLGILGLMRRRVCGLWPNPCTLWLNWLLHRRQALPVKEGLYAGLYSAKECQLEDKWFFTAPRGSRKQYSIATVQPCRPTHPGVRWRLALHLGSQVCPLTWMTRTCGRFGACLQVPGIFWRGSRQSVKHREMSKLGIGQGGLDLSVGLSTN